MPTFSLNKMWFATENLPGCMRIEAHSSPLREEKCLLLGRGTSGQLDNGEIVDRWFLPRVRAQCLCLPLPLVGTCLC
jgi:hypothetical protein